MTSLTEPDNTAMPPDAGSSSSDIPASHDHTAHQLIRYEALFDLLEDLQTLDDIPAIAQQVTKQWKYFANIANWRVMIPDENDYVLIEGFRGQATMYRRNEIDLSSWDRHHWKEHRPAILPAAAIDPALPAPDHLVSPITYELQILPIMRNDKCIALFNVSSRHEAFTPLDKKYIRLLSYYLADRISSLMLQRRIIEALNKKATHDALTGILNRGAVIEQLETILALAKRNSYTVSIIIIDIDLFKTINDNYGHQAGDKVIQEVAQRLGAAKRESDVLGRYGGEEFLVVLNNCSTDQVSIAADRLRKSIANTPFFRDGLNPLNIPVTISAGTASTEGAVGYNSDYLIKQADDALYLSKANGRNQVTIGR
jgi:diguanylate cyclase (GGDEF)-like protein